MKKYLWLFAVLLVFSFPAYAGDFCSYSEDSTPALTDIVIVSDDECEENNRKVPIGNILNAIPSNAIANGQMAQMPAKTIKGNDTGSTANADDLTVPETRALLGLRQEYCFALSDQTTDLATGTSKATFFFPAAGTINGIRGYVNTAPTGSTVIVDCNEAGVTLMAATKLSIDASEKTSGTAASAAVISDSAFAANAEGTCDIDQVGSSTKGKGLVVCLDVTF